MKRHIAVLTVLVLAVSLLASGCTSAQPQVKDSDPLNMDVPVPHNAPEGKFPEGESSDYTAPVIEKENLYSGSESAASSDLASTVQIKAQNGSEYTINSAGVYNLSGTASDFTVKVEAGKEDNVQIVLNNAVITNTDFPVIYVKTADKCTVTSTGKNKLSVSEKFASDGDIKTDAVIFSKADLTLNGSGELTIVSSAGNGISAKDDLVITGGKYDISSASDSVEANDSISISGGEFTVNSNKDAFHCENDEKLGSVYIKDGVFNITAKDDGIQATSYLVIDGGNLAITADEGMEATFVQINGGNISINASDDGINAAKKSDDYDVVIEINGGDIKVTAGPGDTDCLDSNGIIVVNGGTVDVTGRSTFDADRGSTYNGGTIIVNGSVVDSIPQSMQGHGGMNINGDHNPADRPENMDFKGNRPGKGDKDKEFSGMQ